MPPKFNGAEEERQGVTDVLLRTVESRRQKHQPIVNETGCGFEGAIEKASCDQICRKFEVNVWHVVSYLDELQHMRNGLNDMQNLRPIGASLAILAIAAAFVAFDLGQCSAADALRPIEVPGDRAFMESITASLDGSLYVSSVASGGIARVNPGATKAEGWIAPAAFGSRSTFGVFADAKSNTLWVCSNDVSDRGVPGPGSANGSHLKGFDLSTGDGKISLPLPGESNLCNDMTVATDGTVYVTNSLKPQILQLKPGAKALEVWVENKQFQPPSGIGLDGIAVGGDGNIYVNTFSAGDFFRIEVKDSKPGAVTKLETSRPLKLPDGLRLVSGQIFLMIEGGGSLDHVTVNDDKIVIGTIKDGLNQPTAVAKVGGTAFVTEGQLPHLFNPKENGPPRLPFQIVPVAVGDLGTKG
jgi:sugar lactone lactonase YvrE